MLRRAFLKLLGMAPAAPAVAAQALADSGRPAPMPCVNKVSFLINDEARRRMEAEALERIANPPMIGFQCEAGSFSGLRARYESLAGTLPEDVFGADLPGGERPVARYGTLSGYNRKQEGGRS